MPQFILTDESKVVDGVTVRRVRYTRKNRLVKRDGLGGWVEKPENIEGGLVVEEGVVMGNAVIRDAATVCGHAIVKDNAVVRNNACAKQNALVQGDAVLSGNAVVYGKAVVSDQAVVRGYSGVGDYVQVYGDAEVVSSSLRDTVQVGGQAHITDCILWREVFVAGTAALSNSNFNEGIYITGEKDAFERRPVSRMSDEVLFARNTWAQRAKVAAQGRHTKANKASSVQGALHLLLQVFDISEIYLSGDDYAGGIRLGLMEDLSISQNINEEDILAILLMGWSAVMNGDDFEEPDYEATNFVENMSTEIVYFVRR